MRVLGFWPRKPSRPSRPCPTRSCCIPQGIPGYPRISRDIPGYPGISRYIPGYHWNPHFLIQGGCMSLATALVKHPITSWFSLEWDKHMDQQLRNKTKLPIIYALFSILFEKQKCYFCYLNSKRCYSLFLNSNRCYF